jgi:hypothetical protein
MPDTPAITTSVATASQPWPWMTDPIISPAAPPPTAAVPTRLTRCRYEPPASTMVPSRPPMAGSTPSVPLPSGKVTASGTQIARAARSMAGHGTGAGRGRTTSASQSGTTSRIAAARALIRAGPPSSLIAALLAVIVTERAVVPAAGP